MSHSSNTLISRIMSTILKHLSTTIIYPHSPPEKNFNKELEGLRGLAALMVFFGHFFHQKNFIDPTYNPPAWISYFFPGHGAVLIFFILSGYVIGLANQTPTNFKISNYLAKRAIRLYPIYLASILLSLVAIGLGIDFWQLAGNLFFLQNYESYGQFSIPPLSSNSPLWSLSYEVIFYFLFIILIFKKINLILLISFLLLLGLSPHLNTSFPAIIGTISIGFIFWISGLFLVWNKGNFKAERDTGNSFRKILPLIFFICAIEAFKIFHIILEQIGFDNMNWSIVDVPDVLYLPIYLALFFLLLNLKIPKWIIGYTIGSAITIIFLTIYLVISGRWDENYRWPAGIFLFLCTLTSFIIPLRINFIRAFYKTGVISYAIYVFHYPIMTITKDLPINVYFENPQISFLVRVFLISISTMTLAYFFEGKLQPLLY